MASVGCWFHANTVAGHYAISCQLSWPVGSSRVQPWVGEREKRTTLRHTVAMCQIDSPVAIHGARSGPGSSHIPSPWLKHAETASRATGRGAVRTCHAHRRCNGRCRLLKHSARAMSSLFLVAEVVCMKMICVYIADRRRPGRLGSRG